VKLGFADFALALAWAIAAGIVGALLAAVTANPKRMVPAAIVCAILAGGLWLLAAGFSSTGAP
jgi:hypothetical protein